MSRLVIALAGLAALAACGGGGDVDVAVGVAPLPGEVLADPEDPDVFNCLTVVSRYSNTPGVVATGMVSGPEGSTITILADGAPYRCHVDAAGRVTAMIPVT